MCPDMQPVFQGILYRFLNNILITGMKAARDIDRTDIGHEGFVAAEIQ